MNKTEMALRIYSSMLLDKTRKSETHKRINKKPQMKLPNR